jgi:hypothetical protein
MPYLQHRNDQERREHVLSRQLPHLHWNTANSMRQLSCPLDLLEDRRTQQHLLPRYLLKLRWHHQVQLLELHLSLEGPRQQNLLRHHLPDLLRPRRRPVPHVPTRQNQPSQPMLRPDLPHLQWPLVQPMPLLRSRKDPLQWHLLFRQVLPMRWARRHRLLGLCSHPSSARSFSHQVLSKRL